MRSRRSPRNVADSPDDPLPPRRRRFAQEYRVDLNATQAAIRAGYSAKTAYSQGQRLLKDVEVRSAIDLALAKRGARIEVTAEEVIQGLARLARADIRKVLRWGEGLAVKGADGQEHIANGVALIDSSEIDDDTAAAISEIRQGKDGALSVRLYDKRAAWVDLGRHLNLFRDRPIKLDLPVIEDESGVVKALGVVAAAMARGELTPTEAQAVAAVLEAKRRAYETLEQARRLQAIEERLNAGNGTADSGR